MNHRDAARSVPDGKYSGPFCPQPLRPAAVSNRMANTIKQRFDINPVLPQQKAHYNVRDPHVEGARPIGMP